MVNLSHQSSIQRLGSLHQFLCSGGSVSTKNITVLLGPNLCIVHRFGAHRLLKIIEDVQRCATIFILNDYVSDYRTRLLKLHILPLSMLYELNDIFFFFAVVVVVVKSLKQASSSFTITDYVSFTNNNTRSGSHHKLVQPILQLPNTSTIIDFPIYNSLPPIDIAIYKL